MQVQPYLFFNGRAEEAINFYRETLGAKVTAMMRFSEIPDADAEMVTPENADKIMHSNLQIGENQIMISDGMNNGETKFEGFSLTISAPDGAEAERLFAAIAEAGGQIQMPMESTFFASRFGAVEDKFGMSWMVMAEAKGNA